MSVGLIERGLGSRPGSSHALVVETGGVGLVAGTFFGVLIQGLIQTYIVFDGTLSSWWTKIVIGLLLFAFIALQRAIVLMPGRRARPHPAAAE